MTLATPETTTMTNTPAKPYKRILLKISGEALMGDQGFGISQEVMDKVATDIAKASELGVQIAIVVGGGNIFRGLQISTKLGMDRAAADYVGMLATVMNALVLQGLLKKKGVDTRMMSAIDINRVAEPYIRLRAVRHLEKGRVVIFGGGTGNPFFSTDTTSALRAAEINADGIFMAKNGVDGVYNKDPNSHDDAKRFDSLSYDDVMRQNLKVMDQTAISLCKDTGMPIVVFNFNDTDSLGSILNGDLTCGTLIN